MILGTNPIISENMPTIYHVQYYEQQKTISGIYYLYFSLKPAYCRSQVHLNIRLGVVGFRLREMSILHLEENCTRLANNSTNYIVSSTHWAQIRSSAFGQNKVGVLRPFCRKFRNLLYGTYLQKHGFEQPFRCLIDGHK